MAGPLYGRTNLPSDPLTWPSYRKRVLTHATRISGPFCVNTSEGLMTCDDGYLAVDARGYPYPIATDEFELIYDQVDGGADERFSHIAEPHPPEAT